MLGTDGRRKAGGVSDGKADTMADPHVVLLKEDLDGSTREVRISRALREFSTHIAVYLDGGISGGLGLVLTPVQAQAAIKALIATVDAHWDEKSEWERHDDLKPWRPDEAMVERAARQLYNNSRVLHEPGEDWEKLGRERQEIYRCDAADALIAAMRKKGDDDA